jgi:hypothetical protein
MRVTRTGELAAVAAVTALVIVIAFLELRQPEPQPTPVATPATIQPGPPPLLPATRAALDAGNSAFRAKQYGIALSHYRLAAASSPGEAAPWFGVYMAAEAMHNPALADSAQAAIRERTGGRAFGDSAVRALHAKPPAH